MNERSQRVRTGLWLLGLCSLSDIAFIGVPDGPPIPALVVAAVIGVVSLALVIRALRDPTASIRALALLRVLAALAAAPGIVAGDVSTAVTVGASVTVAANLIGLWLLGGSAFRTQPRARTA